MRLQKGRFFSFLGLHFLRALRTVGSLKTALLYSQTAAFICAEHCRRPKGRLALLQNVTFTGAYAIKH